MQISGQIIIHRKDYAYNSEKLNENQILLYSQIEKMDSKAQNFNKMLNNTFQMMRNNNKQLKNNMTILNNKILTQKNFLNELFIPFKFLQKFSGTEIYDLSYMIIISILLLIC